MHVCLRVFSATVSLSVLCVSLFVCLRVCLSVCTDDPTENDLLSEQSTTTWGVKPPSRHLNVSPASALSSAVNTVIKSHKRQVAASDRTFGVLSACLSRSWSHFLVYVFVCLCVCRRGRYYAAADSGGGHCDGPRPYARRCDYEGTRGRTTHNVAYVHTHYILWLSCMQCVCLFCSRFLCNLLFLMTLFVYVSLFVLHVEIGVLSTKFVGQKLSLADNEALADAIKTTGQEIELIGSKLSQLLTTRSFHVSNSANIPQCLSHCAWTILCFVFDLVSCVCCYFLLVVMRVLCLLFALGN